MLCRAAVQRRDPPPRLAPPRLHTQSPLAPPCPRPAACRSCREDVLVWWPLLRHSGILMGDDYSPNSFPGTAWLAGPNVASNQSHHMSTGATQAHAALLSMWLQSCACQHASRLAGVAAVAGRSASTSTVFPICGRRGQGRKGVCAAMRAGQVLQVRCVRRGEAHALPALVLGRPACLVPCMPCRAAHRCHCSRHPCMPHSLDGNKWIVRKPSADWFAEHPDLPPFCTQGDTSHMVGVVKGN